MWVWETSMCGNQQQGQVWQNVLTPPHTHSLTYMARDLATKLDDLGLSQRQPGQP